MDRRCTLVGTVFGPLLCQWWPGVREFTKGLCRLVQVGFHDSFLIAVDKLMSVLQLVHPRLQFQFKTTPQGAYSK